MRVKTDLLASLGRLPRWLPALVWMGGVFYLSSRSDPPAGATGGAVAAMAAHLALYAGLAFLIYWALGDRADTPLWTLVGISFALAVLYGVSDEIHQAFVPERSASEADLALDALGAGLGVTVALLVRTGRGRRRR